MAKTELDGLPVIDGDESEEITVAVRADDVQAGAAKNPARTGTPEGLLVMMSALPQ